MPKFIWKAVLMDVVLKFMIMPCRGKLLTILFLLTLLILGTNGLAGEVNEGF